MRKRFRKFCGIVTTIFFPVAMLNAQTTVNQIVYTPNSDNTAYTVTGFTEGIVDAVIESSINGIPVTTINEKVFTNASSLKSVVIPASITKMGNSIFQNNKSLETVIFEDGDQPLSMGGWTFNGCDKIKEIALPGRLASFGANSNFNGCSALSKISFGDGCKLPDLKSYTFEKTALTELDLSGIENLKTANANCLQNLTSQHIVVTLPKAITAKPKDFLKSCNAVEIIYPEGSGDIAQSSLEGYTQVETLRFPSTLKTVGNSAFKGCTSLKIVNFSENTVLNSSLNYCFENCNALTTVDLSPLKSLKGLVATFKNSGLKEIVFGENSQINTFNWDTFAGTPLESIECPSTLQKIGARAFLNCGNLKTINLPAGVNSINENAFGYDEGQKGVECVVFNQQGGEWPAVDAEGETGKVVILGADTKAYCYKDVTDVPQQVVTVAPMYTETYTTYFNSGCAVEIPDGVKASTVIGLNGGTLVFDFEQYSPGMSLPGMTPVVLSCANPDQTLYPRILPEGSVEAVSPNLLVGSETDEPYRVGFANYVLESTGTGYSFNKVGDGSNVANHAYLSLTPAVAGEVASFPLNNIASGFPEIVVDNDVKLTKIYNLMGTEVNPWSLSPGIYVSNGKKFVVK